MTGPRLAAGGSPATRTGDGSAVAGMARGGLGNLAGAGFAGAAGLGITWLVARGLGPEPAGVFFATVAVTVLVTGVAKLGTPTGLVYWVARLRAQRRPDLVPACLRAGFPPVAIASGLLATGLWFAAPWLGDAVAAGTGQPDTATAVLRTLAPFLPLAALTDAFLAATRGYQLMHPTVVLDKLTRPGLQVLGLGTLTVVTLWTVPPLPLWALAWALPVLPVALLAGHAVAAAERAAPRPGGQPAAAGQPGIRRAFWRFTAPRAVASVLHLALQRLDILLVALLAGPAPAAIYTVAGRFVVLGQLANQALGNSVQPRLAHRLGVGDVAGAAALFRTSTGWLVLTSWPLYLLAANYAPLYLGLFGAPYRTAGTVVVVLAAAMLLATLCGPVDMMLAMAGRTSWNLGNAAAALAVMVGVNLALVPRIGVVGAAVGLAAAVTVNNLLPLAQLWHALRVHPFGAGTLTAAGLAVGCFGIVPALSSAAVGTGPATAAATTVLATALYAAGAYRLRRPLALDVLATARHHRREGDADAQ